MQVLPQAPAAERPTTATALQEEEATASRVGIQTAAATQMLKLLLTQTASQLTVTLVEGTPMREVQVTRTANRVVMTGHLRGTQINREVIRTAGQGIPKADPGTRKANLLRLVMAVVVNIPTRGVEAARSDQEEEGTVSVVLRLQEECA
jgi:hypothetical protein